MQPKRFSRWMEFMFRVRHSLKSVLARIFKDPGKGPGLLTNSGGRDLQMPAGAMPQQAGCERPPAYYDEAFTRDKSFHVPFYQSAYYPSWVLIVDRIRRYGSVKLLDIGCGPGQFAALVADAGFSGYTGVDFSEVAIEKAKARLPQFRFLKGDVRRLETYRDIDYDTVICMEVLEHISEDLQVIASIREGVRCLLTVPNFPWRSHIRHFENADAVVSRYGGFFDNVSVTRIKGVRTETEQFFLIDGIRNATVPIS